MSKIKKAEKAAQVESRSLGHRAAFRANRATATMYVPKCVIDVAKAAYDEAEGNGEIAVVGHGNATHPVCSVSVKRAK